MSVCQVLDNGTGEQVAQWRGHVDTDMFAKEMFKLGWYYNEALISIEVNFDTHPVKELERLKYRKQYRREIVDTIGDKEQHKYGFRTTSSSRPLIIGELVQIVREEAELVNDLETLGEALTFIRNNKGKPEAQQGKHDDCILALAIAHNARGQQKMTRIEQKKSGLEPGGTYAVGELRMMGYSDSQIRQMRNKVKIIGQIPNRK